ncbi:MAG: MTH895/ArsE family thioredoxin-like protein, partial [Rhodospirillales bacterium]
AGANKAVAYGTASISGTILAVCSCTVLPLFGGLYRRGAGLGPAIAFLDSGPAINVLAIVLTAKVLGHELGLARAVGAVAFSVLIGLAMAGLYRREERERRAAAASAELVLPDDGHAFRPAAVSALFALMIAFLVFANWAQAEAEDSAVWHALFAWKWPLSAASAGGVMLALVLGFGFVWWRVGLVAAAVVAFAIAMPQQPQLAIAAGVVGLCLVAALQPGAGQEWFEQTWGFAKLILPLLLLGVLAAGFLLGRPGHEGLIPSAWVAAAVGGNSLAANAFAAIAGAFMYFATLTEIPITQALIGAGIGQGPGIGAATRRSGPVAAQHAGDPRLSRHREDVRLRRPGRGHGDRERHDLRHLLVLRSIVMVDLKILGSGCAKCVRLAENAEAAAKELGLAYTLGKITDRNEIVDAGVMVTPALMIDGKVKSSGKVLTPEQIKALLA